MRFAFVFTGMAVMLMVPAFAYVDPSVTSMAIQAVAGVLWSKAKKKAKQVLNIDENAGKTVESDVVVFDEAEKADEAKEEIKQ